METAANKIAEIRKNSIPDSKTMAQIFFGAVKYMKVSTEDTKHRIIWIMA